MQAGRMAEIFNLANRFRHAGEDSGGYEMLLLSATGGAVYSSSGIPSGPSRCTSVRSSACMRSSRSANRTRPIATTRRCPNGCAAPARMFAHRVARGA